MDKRLLVVIIVVIALVAGAIAYLNLVPQESVTTKLQNSSDENEATEDNENAPIEASQQQQAGAYNDYSEKAVNETSGTKVLFFHAPWCPQCRELEASIRASTIPDGVTIFKVDYDTNQALRSKYGVTLQTTLVKIDEEGELVKKFVAYDEPTFASVEENLLK